MPCGPKQILAWVYFDSAWFLKILLGSFPSASWHQYLYGIEVNQTKFDLPVGLLSLSLVSQKLVASRHQRVQKSRFTRPLEPNQVCASFPLAFWTQTNFDMVYFPSAWFLQNLLGYVSLSFTASTCREESFHLALRT